MKTPSPSMQKRRTSTPSNKVRTGIDRLYKRVGVHKVSFYYQFADGSSETLAVAPRGDKQAVATAERVARRKAFDINEGAMPAGSVAKMIERFKDEIAPTRYLDQSREGLRVRQGAYDNLIKFFGRMKPSSLRTVHGYQYLDARAKSGAPAKANKELSQMSTICQFGVRWGEMESNPFTGMEYNSIEKDVRMVTRSQIVRFYFWSLRQTPTFRNLGCAAMFAYLTGFRAAEVRPFHVDGLSDSDGVRVLSAKRKKGQTQVVKVRNWSKRLRVVVARAKQTHTAKRMYLFANSSGKPYTGSGWASVWSDAMFEWIASFDLQVAAELAAKKAWEVTYRAAYRGESAAGEFIPYKLTEHPAYFSLSDVRPAAITTKLRQRSVDAYDFAGHADPHTTHQHYDRRTEKRASATE